MNMTNCELFADDADDLAKIKNSLGGELVQHLRNNYDWDARLVGGAIRDIYLGKEEEIRDWDIVVSTDPDLLANALQILVAPKKIQTFGLSHGVVSAKHHGHHITLSACRKDVAPISQRHAKVEFGKDWHADAARRDFTCNAIYFDGNQIWDPFGGVQDLNKRFVRFIGDPHQRIQEDILRFWRFYRFWAHLGNAQEVDLSQHVTSLSRLSQERTYMELKQLMKGAHAVTVLKKLEGIGVIAPTIELQ